MKWIIFFLLFGQTEQIEVGEKSILAFGFEWTIAKVVKPPVTDGDKILSAHYELACNGETAVMIVKNKGVVFTMFGDKPLTIDFEQLVHHDSLYTDLYYDDIILLRKEIN